MFLEKFNIPQISKTIFFLLLLFSTIILSQVDTTFNGLRGYEDLQCSTQLFYRFQSDNRYELPNDNIGGVLRNDIFHFDVTKNIDSLFILDYLDFHTPLPTLGKVVSDFEFVDNTLTDFYQCGDGVTSFEPGPIVIYNRDYNNPFGVNSFHGETSNMEIVNVNNELKVYVSTNDGVYTQSISRSFDIVNTTEGLRLLSINKNEPNIFYVNNIDNYLLKSLDTATTFFVVDSITSINSYRDYYWDLINRRFLYDSNEDQNYIYRIVRNNFKFQLVVSDNNGELNSWTKKFESDDEIYISNDHNPSGLLYLATGKEIYESNDYGMNFQLFKQLDHKILGLYKKPNSEYIYATTSHSLLELTSESTKVLKETINYTNSENISLSDSTLFLYQNALNSNYADTTWLINRSSKILMVDSVLTQHLYSYSIEALFSNQTTKHFRILNNLGDTATFSVDPNDSVRIILSDPDLCPICKISNTTPFTDSLQIFTNSEKYPILLLSIIGDGTLNTETNELPNRFSLSQNYPNPFNPSTIIKYSIPSNQKNIVVATNLVVFNILGQNVSTLVNQVQKAGDYEMKFDASGLTSGIYICRLTSGGFNKSIKMLFIR